jgi:hypothetical protein
MRVEIYREAYFARIIESLTDDFPKIRELLGEEEFEDTVHAYLKKYPSRYFNLAQVGRDIPKFLEEAFPSRPELADLAKDEWAQCLCRWSESSEPMDFTKLLELSSEEQLRQKLLLSSSAQFVKTGQGTRVHFNVRGETISQELTPSMEELFSEIQSGKTLGEMTEKFQANAELAAVAMSWISNWVSQGLIVGFTSA